MTPSPHSKFAISEYAGFESVKVSRRHVPIRWKRGGGGRSTFLYSSFARNCCCCAKSCLQTRKHAHVQTFIHAYIRTNAIVHVWVLQRRRKKVMLSMTYFDTISRNAWHSLYEGKHENTTSYDGKMWASQRRTKSETYAESLLWWRFQRTTAK